MPGVEDILKDSYVENDKCNIKINWLIIYFKKRIFQRRRISTKPLPRWQTLLSNLDDDLKDDHTFSVFLKKIWKKERKNHCNFKNEYLANECTCTVFGKSFFYFAFIKFYCDCFSSAYSISKNKPKKSKNIYL